MKLLICLFPNFNGATVKVWEWINNVTPHFILYVITYPCWDIKTLYVNMRGPIWLLQGKHIIHASTLHCWLPGPPSASAAKGGMFTTFDANFTMDLEIHVNNSSFTSPYGSGLFPVMIPPLLYRGLYKSDIVLYLAHFPTQHCSWMHAYGRYLTVWKVSTWKFPYYPNPHGFSVIILIQNINKRHPIVLGCLKWVPITSYYVSPYFVS